MLEDFNCSWPRAGDAKTVADKRHSYTRITQFPPSSLFLSLHLYFLYEVSILIGISLRLAAGE